MLFYKPGHYLENPGEILALWRGGMSFHGGMLGVIGATLLFARRRGVPLLALGDVVALAAPIGLFFGRIANFINAALAFRAWRRDARLRPGMLSGAFLVGYSLARIACEFFREPDAHLGFLYAGATMGQLLCLPMLAAGIALVARARRAPPPGA